MLSRSLATIAVVVAALIVIVGGPKLGRAGIQPATPIAINGDLGGRVAALETRVAAVEAHLGTPQGASTQDVSLPSTPPALAVANDAQVAEVTIEGYDINWDQKSVIVTPGTTVKLVNTGAAGHNFEVTELGINVDMPVGETVEVNIPGNALPGTYKFICNIPGHKEAGMVGELLVLGIAPTLVVVASLPATPPLAQASTASVTLPQSAHTGNWDVTVTRTEVSEGFEGIFEQQVPRGVYFFVHMTATSMGTMPGALPFTDLALTDSAGRTYSLDSDATSDWLIQNTDLNLFSELQPGLPYDVIAIFDIPPAATGLALTTKGQQFTIPLDR